MRALELLAAVRKACDGFCRKEDVSVVRSIPPFWPAKLSLRRQRPQRPLASATMASHAGDDPVSTNDGLSQHFGENTHRKSPHELFGKKNVIEGH